MILTEGIKYLGSKNKLLPYIIEIVNNLDDVNTVLDGFAGTTRVGQALRAVDKKVYSNDLSDYSYVFSKCYLETGSNIDVEELKNIIEHLNTLGGTSGIITEYYSGGSTSEKKGVTIQNDIMFWKKKNTMRADAIRKEIEKFKDNEYVYYILITALIMALDKVDNTVGVQQAFLKNSWAARADKDLKLKVPNILYSKPKGIAYKANTNELVKDIKVDLAYYDPPYTSHNYSSYYHIWDTVVKNDIGEVSGIINRPKDVSKSDYNFKRKAAEAFGDLVSNTNSKYILISYNNEGIISFKEMEAIAKSFGSNISIQEIDYKRNVMSQIGIHNSNGDLVGTPGHKRNIEYLILISR